MENIQERQDRIRKLENLKDLKINPYPSDANRTHYIKEVFSNFDDLLKEEKNISVVGRLRSIRSHGNLTFANIEDVTGKIQLAISKKEVGVDDYKLFVKNFDVGDFIEIEGVVFVTHKGEQSINIKKFKILSKALLPLPDKWAGLQDQEEKFRKRYLDIALNQELKELFIRRSKFWQSIRRFMTDKGFFEVETPTLETTTGGAEARPFETFHNDFKIPVYLRICIGELWQKRLMAAGFEKTFEIGRAYRNEGSSPDHLQEFTNMEFYWAYADYSDGMKLTQELYRFIAQEVYGRTDFEARGHKFDLADEWIKIDYVEEIEKQTGVNILKATEDELKDKLAKLKVKYDGENKERLIDSLWKYCRANIAGPAFLINHPVIIAPLAKRRKDNPEQTERFQPILGGAEVGNGYSELNDPIDQRARFEEQKKLLDAGDDEAMMPDWEFVEMLEHGMPPTCGFGVGERLFAFLENKTLREVTLFPLMKTKEIEKKNKDAKIAVALINKGSQMESWQKMNTIAHLSASFASRKGKKLLEQDEITTEDNQKIKLNIQHAIMIKEAEDNREIIEVIKQAKMADLEVVEFTRDMIETTNDTKLIKNAIKRKFDDFEYLGVLIFGQMSIVNKLTKKFNLYK